MAKQKRKLDPIPELRHVAEIIHRELRNARDLDRGGIEQEAIREVSDVNYAADNPTITVNFDAAELKIEVSYKWRI